MIKASKATIHHIYDETSGFDQANPHGQKHIHIRAIAQRKFA
jgi:hypothetical protein